MTYNCIVTIRVHSCFCFRKRSITAFHVKIAIIIYGIYFILIATTQHCVIICILFFCLDMHTREWKQANSYSTYQYSVKPFSHCVTSSPFISTLSPLSYVIVKLQLPISIVLSWSNTINSNTAFGLSATL